MNSLTPVRPRLVIGNRNYSSWSLRPWLLLRQCGVVFDTELIPLDTADFESTVARVSPSRRVPVLVDADVTVWDSLAIGLYAAERWPQVRLWPQAPTARAQAMAVTAEMHSGFAALRGSCPMNIRRRLTDFDLPEAAAADARRIQQIWREARERFGADGEFLFGEFGLADAFFAPVATRFQSYGLRLDPLCQRYVDALMALPAMVEWCAAAAAEPWTIAATEAVGG
ncbi:MAG: glutathione S-transferase family protein [Lysobacterales bacterium]